LGKNCELGNYGLFRRRTRFQGEVTTRNDHKGAAVGIHRFEQLGPKPERIIQIFEKDCERIIVRNVADHGHA
jgi:hypothetical protein